jgi:hypothetical protein
MALILCGGALQEEEERHFYVRAAVGRAEKKVLVASVCGQCGLEECNSFLRD